MTNTRGVKTECPTCGDLFKSLGQHFRFNPDHRKDISSNIMDILTGIFMGDGTLVNKNNKLKCIRVSMTNRTYLRHIRELIGWLSTGNITLSVDKSENVRYSKNLYSLVTVPHPQFDVFFEWYNSGSKRYPDDIRLNRDIVRHWYCCDGGLHWKDSGCCYATITCSNEIDRAGWLIGLFEDIGFEAGSSVHSITFREAETKRLLEWMGDPPPGFEYKWENVDEKRYRRLIVGSYNE